MKKILLCIFGASIQYVVYSGSCSPNDNFGSPSTVSLGTSYNYSNADCTVSVDCTDSNPNGTGWLYDICDDANASGGFAQNGDCYGEIMGPTCSIGACFGGCGGSAENTNFAQFCPSSTGTYMYNVSNISCTGGGASLQFAFWGAAYDCISGAVLCSGAQTANFSQSMDLTGGQCYRITFDGNAAAACTWTFQITQVLSVEFSQFKAQKSVNSKQVTLSWQTLVEENSEAFLVQKSTNGVMYSTIATVVAAGNSKSARNYNYTDKNPQMGENYYRIAQVDKDGTTAYTKSVSVYIKSRFEVMNLYSANGKLSATFSNDDNKPVSVSVVGLDGKEVYKKDYDSQEGQNNINISTSEIGRSGIYLVVFDNGTTKEIKKIFIN